MDDPEQGGAPGPTLAGRDTATVDAGTQVEVRDGGRTVCADTPDAVHRVLERLRQNDLDCTSVVLTLAAPYRDITQPLATAVRGSTRLSSLKLVLDPGCDTESIVYDGGPVDRAVKEAAYLTVIDVVGAATPRQWHEVCSRNCCLDLPAPRPLQQSDPDREEVDLTNVPWAFEEDDRFRPPNLMLADRIAGGSMGEVYKVSIGGVDVAAKVPHCLLDLDKDLFLLKTDPVARKTIHKDLMRELSALRRLKGHRNIVGFQGVAYIVLEGLLMPKWICMNYVEQTLHDRILKGQVNFLADVQGILAGLEYIHSQGMMHRDIKPSNILVDVDDTVQMADLGFVRVWHRFSQALGELTLVGTPSYLAPDAGGTDYDPGRDIYAFGVTAVQMVLRNAPATEHKGRMEQVKLAAAKAPTFAWLYVRCCERWSADRPSARGLQIALKTYQFQTCLDHDAVVAQRDALAMERDALVTDLAAEENRVQTLVAERDAFQTEKEVLVKEIDALVAEKEALAAERDRQQANAAAAEVEIRLLKAEAPTVEVKVIGKERSEGICNGYTQQYTYVTQIPPGDITSIVDARSMQAPSLDDIGTAGQTVFFAHDPNITLREYIEAQINEIVGISASSLAGLAISGCVEAISTVVKGLDASKVRVVQNREFEFEDRIKDNAGIEDRRERFVAMRNFEGALELEDIGRKHDHELNDDILADADSIKANIAYDERYLLHEVDAAIDKAVVVNNEGRAGLIAVCETLCCDLAGMKATIANIDIESTATQRALEEQQEAFDKSLQEGHEDRSGLFAVLGTVFHSRRTNTAISNAYHIAVEIHANCTQTLTKLRDTSVDQVARHVKSLEVANTIVAAHDRIDNLLQTVREVVKAEFKERLDGPIPTEEAQYGIISNRKYERVLLKKSVELLFAVLPRDYRVVQAMINDVKVKNIELETTTKKLKAAYQLKDRTQMAKHQARINELKEELVTSEVNLAEQHARFEQCIINTRYEESRRRLFDEYGETEETIGMSVLEVVKEISNVTSDLDSDNDPFQTSTNGPIPAPWYE